MRTTLRRSEAAQRVRAQALDLRRHFRCGEGELAAHGRGQVDHLDALSSQTDLLQQVTYVFYSFAGVQITNLVMAFALQSARHHHAVYAVLEGAQQI